MRSPLPPPQPSWGEITIDRMVGKGRHAPLHPDDFAELIRTKVFTVDSDKELTVHLYTQV
jgi:hypothetical protein